MMKATLKRLAPLGLLLGTTLLIVGCGGSSSSKAAADTEDSKLAFDSSAYTTLNITVDGEAMAVRQYKIVYVANPVKMAATQPTWSSGLYAGEATLDDPYIYQTMYVSVPEASVSNQTTGIYLAVNNSGWKPSKAAPFNKDRNGNDVTAFVSNSETDKYGAALAAGYIVVDAGTRSRELRIVDGKWAGKAPACVVDTKAIIRYLRLNDKVMPGSAERIIVNGTSGGGGLTAAVAASGNSPDYYPYLAEIGAAGISGSGSSATSTLKDDIFAAVAYCPINNLGNADAGYEWQYQGVRSDSNTGALNSILYSAGPQPAASTAIKAYFAPYLNGLGLKLDDGTTALTDANMAAQIKAWVEEGVEYYVSKGGSVPAIDAAMTANGTALTNTWCTVVDGQATIDYDKFVAFVAASKNLKTVVAFDPCGVTGNPGNSGESDLFGESDQIYSNYTKWTWINNRVWGDTTGFDDTGLSWEQYLADAANNTLAKQLKLVNPIDHLTGTVASPAPYWYIRHGGADRDTAFAMQVLLYHAVKNNSAVQEVNFRLPYLVPHSGNYDVQDAFTWIKAKLDANPL